MSKECEWRRTLAGESDRRCERPDLVANLLEIRAVVDRQAEDEGLWSLPLTGLQRAPEAYLQQELRHLHKVIEDYTDGLEETT